MEITAFGLTDVGRHRDHNEDAMLVAEDIGLYVVCDGMGGAAAGEVASTRCIEVVHQIIRDNYDVVTRYVASPSTDHRQDVVRLVEHAITAANAAIYELAAAEPDKRGMGTTVVLLLVAGANAIMGHVGDSRIYLLRGELIHQLTEDHSLVAEQLRRGLITEEEAESSNLNNVIMRAVGTREYTQVDSLYLELMPGDRFVLCSDGLSGQVDSPDIGATLGEHDPGSAAGLLVEQANAAGGPDNITAVVLHVADDAEPATEIPIARKLEFLRGTPVFAHFTFKELMLLMGTAAEREYQGGELIIEEGQVGEEFFVLLSGEATVTKGDRPIAELEPGAHFGEMCLLDQAPRSASVIAKSHCKALALRRDAVYPLMQREPHVAVKMLWALCHELIGRLRETSAELSGTQQKMEKIIDQMPFYTTPGIEALRTRAGIEPIKDDE